VTVFILVHGAWHGGWCWRRTTRLLRAVSLAWMLFCPAIARQTWSLRRRPKNARPGRGASSSLYCSQRSRYLICCHAGQGRHRVRRSRQRPGMASARTGGAATGRGERGRSDPFATFTEPSQLTSGTWRRTRRSSTQPPPRFSSPRVQAVLALHGLRGHVRRCRARSSWRQIKHQQTARYDGTAGLWSCTSNKVRSRSRAPP
jgi:hypothetical protein